VLDHNAVFTAEMAAGDVLLFDLRTLHRGGANGSPTQRRAQIYATFVTEWYVNSLATTSECFLRLLLTHD